MEIDSITLLRLDESMTTVWDSGFCQFTGSSHFRPGTWQSRITSEQFQWLSSAAGQLGTETRRRRTASQSLIVTGNGEEWRIEEQANVKDPNFWIVATVMDGIVGRAFWAPLDPAGEQDFYQFSLEPHVTLASGFTRARGHAVAGGVFVLAGAVASTSESPSLQKYYHEVRRDMIETQQLEYSGGDLMLTQHVFFDSPSKAACVLTGSTTNGRTAWKTATGEPIGSLKGYNDYT
jgi:hypothetical protein